MTDWHWIEDGSPADDDDAERYADAVYDADDPDWQEILDDDGRADYDDSDDSEGADVDWGDPADWGWDDWPDDFDGEYYEYEIGIDYGGDE